MHFRTKLILLVVLVNLLTGAALWQLISSARAINKQVQLFVPLAGYLQGISGVHSSLTRQSKEVLGYLISQDKLDNQKFLVINLELEDNFRLWKQSALWQQSLGLEGEAEDLELIARSYEQYRHWQDALTEIFSLAEQGNRTLALTTFKHHKEESLNQRLLPALDEALKDGVVEAEDTYHGLLIAVGTSPWGAAGYSKQLDLIHVSMDYLLGGNQANASINIQFSHLVEYLVSGQPKNLLDYEHSLAVSREALNFWYHAAERKSQLEESPDRNSASLVTSVTSSFQNFWQEAAIAIQLKKSGKTQDALNLVLGQNDLLIADFQENTARAIQNGAELLIATTATRRTAGYILFVLFLGLTSFISIRTAKGMISSIYTLGASMDTIRAGNLEHRIIMKKGDVIGNLAETFNAMMDSLNQTRDALEKLTTELEQRVHDRTAQLAAANRDLESFNAMVSHDLRTPLTLMHGYSEFLHTQLGSNATPLISTALNKVMTACGDMSTTVSALESLAHVSRKQLERQPVSLEELVRKTMAQLSATAPQRKVELVIEPAPEAQGDQGLLEIAMANLLSNAWKYTSKTAGAKIEFGSLEQDGRQLWFVRDNGAGFDMSKADRLFEAFCRLHAQNEFSGTGIGLSTVQRIIHRHGGEIWAEGRVEEGATFYFHLGEDSTPAEQAKTTKWEATG